MSTPDPCDAIRRNGPQRPRSAPAQRLARQLAEARPVRRREPTEVPEAPCPGDLGHRGLVTVSADAVPSCAPSSRTPRSSSPGVWSRCRRRDCCSPRGLSPAAVAISGVPIASARVGVHELERTAESLVLRARCRTPTPARPRAAGTPGARRGRRPRRCRACDVRAPRPAVEPGRRVRPDGVLPHADALGRRSAAAARRRSPRRRRGLGRTSRSSCTMFRAMSRWCSCLRRRRRAARRGRRAAGRRARRRVEIEARPAAQPDDEELVLDAALAAQVDLEPRRAQRHPLVADAGEVPRCGRGAPDGGRAEVVAVGEERDGVVDVGPRDPRTSAPRAFLGGQGGCRPSGTGRGARASSPSAWFPLESTMVENLRRTTTRQHARRTPTLSSAGSPARCSRPGSGR